MQRASGIYQQIAAYRAHVAIICLVMTSVLLVSTGGVVSSAVMFLVVIGGLASLTFDPETREALLGPGGVRLLVCLLALVLLWQGLGVVLRTPTDLKATAVLGSAFGITMLLPILVAAAKRETKLWSQLLLVLFGLGCIAAIASLLRHFIMLGSVANLSLSGLLRERLIPVGRATHQILGAGGLAPCFFAGLALYPRARLHRRGLIIAGLLLIALTIILTQSRGPILGICLAVPAAYSAERLNASPLRTSIAFALTLLCFLIPVSLIVMEPWVKDLVCTSQISICRSSNRQDVWASVAQMVTERPWLGIGPTFRFPEGSVSHPHNGLLGLIFFFGLPMGVLFVGIVWAALKQTLKAPRSIERTFALFGIFFSVSFIATDLSNPFGFVNTHYLYLWLPIFVGSIAGSLYRDGADSRSPPPSSHE